MTITDTQYVDMLLDEAEAIVQAEWMRLIQDENLWERELADLIAEMPAPRPHPPRLTTTALPRRPQRPSRMSSVRSARWRWQRRLRARVRATQRSPPRPDCSVPAKCPVPQWR